MLNPLLKKCLKDRYGIELLRDGGNAYQLASVQIIPDDASAPKWVIDETSPFDPMLKPVEVFRPGIPTHFCGPSRQSVASLFVSRRGLPEKSSWLIFMPTSWNAVERILPPI